MQIPKILGGKAGSGELPELIRHIAQTGKEINWLSVILGAGALILLRVAGKMIPKFPMAIVIMAAGVAATRIFHVDEYGVVLPSILYPFFIAKLFSDKSVSAITTAAIIKLLCGGSASSDQSTEIIPGNDSRKRSLL